MSSISNLKLGPRHEGLHQPGRRNEMDGRAGSNGIGRRVGRGRGTVRKLGAVLPMCTACTAECTAGASVRGTRHPAGHCGRAGECPTRGTCSILLASRQLNNMYLYCANVHLYCMYCLRLVLACRSIGRPPLARAGAHKTESV